MGKGNRNKKAKAKNQRKMEGETVEKPFESLPSPAVKKMEGESEEGPRESVPTLVAKKKVEGETEKFESLAKVKMGGEVEERAWESLPTLALVNIFRKTTIKDRMENIPMVCTSWNRASGDPRCWASMVAESHHKPAVADEVFVKVPGCDGYYPRPASIFLDPFDGKRSSNGATMLETLIRRAGNGAATTSLYIFPFLAPDGTSPNDNDLLRLVARSCPNLKHFSFNKSTHASEETVLEVIRNCTNLELVDFSYSPYCTISVLEEMSRCCPKLRGIRVKMDCIGMPELSAIATSFPGLKLLNLSETPLSDAEFLILLSGCQGLEFLDTTECVQNLHDLNLIKRAYKKFPEFLYDMVFDDLVVFESDDDGAGCYDDYCYGFDEEHFDDYTRPDYYDEDGEYVGYSNGTYYYDEDGEYVGYSNGTYWKGWDDDEDYDE